MRRYTAKRRPYTRSGQKRRGGARRRYVPKKRTYRKNASRTMTRKSILNLTASKKRDTMLVFTNMTAASQSGGTSYASQAAIVNAQTDINQSTLPIVYCPTARDGSVSAGGAYGTKIAQSTRTASSCFMRGVSERIEIQIPDGFPWQWRRICFTYKNFTTLVPETTALNYNLETSFGFTRTINMMNPSQTALFESILFKGQRNSDWLDPMTAPVDNSRVTLKYDHTTNLSSGNEEGIIRKFNLWHSMNKTLVYADDEVGGNEATARFSVSSKAGMGDYFIVDYFKCRQGATSSQQISLAVNATLYWHER